MKGLAAILAVALTGCVGAEAPVSREVTIDGARMLVSQQAETDLFGLMADADGNMAPAVVGAGRAVVVSGAADQAMAIRAMGEFCGIAVDPADWDTAYVHRFDGTDDYQFSGLCG